MTSLKARSLIFAFSFLATLPLAQAQSSRTSDPISKIISGSKKETSIAKPAAKPVAKPVAAKASVSKVVEKTAVQEIVVKPKSAPVSAPSEDFKKISIAAERAASDVRRAEAGMEVRAPACNESKHQTLNNQFDAIFSGLSSQ